ncbi:MAG: hypothetical protein JKX98_04245, partial [Alcanivoracaceae bacterium]|nr:hypothetical protein [Alcanivoracaceae bacterium]
HKKEFSDWIKSQLIADRGYRSKEVEPLSMEIMVLIEGAIILSQITKDNAPIVAAKRTCEMLLTK